MHTASHNQPTNLITTPLKVKSNTTCNGSVVQQHDVLSVTTNIVDKRSVTKNSKKRSASDIGLSEVSRQAKKRCLLNPIVHQPLGVKWDRNSCAYDAILGILFNIWNEDHISHSRLFHKSWRLGPRLNAHFSKIKKKQAGFSLERNLIRIHIARLIGNNDVYGYNSLYNILNFIFLRDTVFSITNV